MKVLVGPYSRKGQSLCRGEYGKGLLSDDLNKILLKFQAKIFVGYLTVELKEAKNIRHPLALVE